MRTALLLGLIVAACGDDDTRVCIPGQSVACVGPGGCFGAQQCNQDGTGYLFCDCGSTADAGVVDVSSVVDAGNDAPSLDAGADGPLVDAAVPDAPIDAMQIDASTVGGLAGTVYAPGNAPGMVAVGQEIPVSGASVYLTTTPPATLPTGAYQDLCLSLPTPGVVTGPSGSFTLDPVAVGSWYLVVEKAQFRLVTPVEVVPGTVVTLPVDATTLPSENDASSGKTIPTIALAVGTYDALETVLGKIGLGEVDASGDFTGWGTGAPDFTFFGNGGTLPAGVTPVALNTLVSDLALMRQFHIIVVPCSAGDNSQLFTSATIRDNIRSYIAEGGKWFVTDWSAEWEDVVFPEFIVFAGDHDTPAGATSSADFSDGDGSPSYDSDPGRAADTDLRTWLTGQYGPNVETGALETFDGDSFRIEGNWNHIDSLPAISIGVDSGGAPVTEQAKVWVEGTDGSGTDMHPLTVMFEPIGYGRVLYSTFHTAGYPSDPHVGLVPQERALVYLLLELGMCKSAPIAVP